MDRRIDYDRVKKSCTGPPSRLSVGDLRREQFSGGAVL